MTVLMEIVVHHLAVHVYDTATVSIIILSSAASNRRTVITSRSGDCSLIPNQQFSQNNNCCRMTCNISANIFS